MTETTLKKETLDEFAERISTKAGRDGGTITTAEIDLVFDITNDTDYFKIFVERLKEKGFSEFKAGVLVGIELTMSNVKELGYDLNLYDVLSVYVDDKDEDIQEVETD